MSHKSEQALLDIKDFGWVVVGEFVNEHGEKYVLYTTQKTPGLVWITGDELDWTLDNVYLQDNGYILSSVGLAAVAFSLSAKEKAAINKIINDNSI